MENRSNKTIICSVLFLDIVEYSKMSVSGQISLKERFNTYLSEGIQDVPPADRIILDTGDGAAVNFLGDVESALKAALHLRECLLNEDLDIEPKLLVRIGINLGPVRLVRDINGQPNIVGDGINVAQRVMGFADPSQILVSRSYYEAVSRLSPQYAGMFHHKGSRTDKHVREHEVYAIGYPGDQTGVGGAADSESEESRYGAMIERVRTGRDRLIENFRSTSETVSQADGKRRALYAGMVGLPVLLLIMVFVFMPEQQGEHKPVMVVETLPSASAVPALNEVEINKMDVSTLHKPVTESKSKQEGGSQSVSHKPHTSEKLDKKAVVSAKTSLAKSNQSQGQTQSNSQNSSSKPEAKESDKSIVDRIVGGADPALQAYISLKCKSGVQVFLDGAQKQSTGTDSLLISTHSGKHKLILTHSSFGIYSESITVEPGKTARVSPKVCD